MYNVLFSNENVLVIEKMQGIAVQPDSKDETSLIEIIKNEFGQECELCHRLDRNTGGIIVIARNEKALSVVTNAIKENKIKKYYKAVLCGKISDRFPDAIKGKFQRLTAWHFKDAKKSRVYIYDFQKKFSKKIITDFRILNYDKEQKTTLIEVRLITGRTHQIRAQFSYIGYPVAGDGKYGKNVLNKKLKYKNQALWAYKIDFCGALAELGVPDVFVSEPRFK